MSKADRISFVRAGLEAYGKLNDRSKAQTSKEAWIAFKLGCAEKAASKYVQEAEADATTIAHVDEPAIFPKLNKADIQLCYIGVARYRSDYPDADEARLSKLLDKLVKMGAKR